MVVDTFAELDGLALVIQAVKPFTPLPAVGASFDHFVGTTNERDGRLDAKRLRGL
jgi:hypothetical protein